MHSQLHKINLIWGEGGQDQEWSEDIKIERLLENSGPSGETFWIFIERGDLKLINS